MTEVTLFVDDAEIKGSVDAECEIGVEKGREHCCFHEELKGNCESFFDGDGEGGVFGMGELLDLFEREFIGGEDRRLVVKGFHFGVKRKNCAGEKKGGFVHEIPQWLKVGEKHRG